MEEQPFFSPDRLHETIEFAEVSIAESSEMLEILPEGLDMVLEIFSSDGAGAAIRLGYPHGSIRYFLTCGLDAGHAIFALMNAPPGTELKLVFDGRKVTLSSHLEIPGARVVNWQRTLYLALILRHKSALASLLDVDLGRLPSRGILVDSYREDWSRCLQAFLRGEVWRESLRRCRESAQRATIAGPNYVRHIDEPLFGLLEAVASHDSDALHKALAHSLTGHRAHWESPDLKHTFGGELALGPLAFRCLAYDQGLDVELEDELIPRWLVGGS